MRDTIIGVAVWRCHTPPLRGRFSKKPAFPYKITKLVCVLEEKLQGGGVATCHTCHTCHTLDVMHVTLVSGVRKLPRREPLHWVRLFDQVYLKHSQKSLRVHPSYSRAGRGATYAGGSVWCASTPPSRDPIRSYRMLQCLYEKGQKCPTVNNSIVHGE